MRTTSLAVLGVSLSALLFATACRGDDTSDDGNNDSPGIDGSVDGRPGDGPVNAGEVTVKEVQADTLASGTQIELKGVVVTAIDTFGAKTGDLWVEDVGGGAFSGVKVFGASLSDVATLAVGDVVNITGAQKYEFACTGTICGTGVFDPGQSITEVEGTTAGSLVITKTGANTPITPDAVDLAAIAALSTEELRNAEWEKWEGVLIKLPNVLQNGAVGMFGAGEDDQKKFLIPGGVTVESVMAPFPAAAAADYCYSTLTGVGDYFFDYLLLPRSAADFGAAGTACTGQAAATTIAQVQAGTATGSVTIDNVFVTAISANKKNAWVSTSLTAATNQGVLVFRGNGNSVAVLPDTIVVGAKVKVTGTVQEFDNAPPGDTVTELAGVNASITFVAAPTTPPVPLTATAALLGDIGAPGEPYEGVLVTVANVKVTNVNTGMGKVELTDNASGKVTMDDESFAFPAQTAPACYATVTGVMHVQVNDNVRTINPRSAADLVTGTGCL